ncbi:protein phosphatase 1 regulatory subunit 3A isoform X2 [Oncorhynchus tshawytscha]|uniref:protein phosphatase 1 regulatory subunit 3A isoform X2 n=1 Tax=Oncorhynchus tshawytscha TaxID=74940 RepID=UPI000D0A2F31|nr:protein phosphatase 1 regulatory subunit 3A isoform X2 [Oncorhynchus tshawytscha]
MEAPDTRTWGSRDIKEGGVREEEERGSLPPQKNAMNESDESDGSEPEPPAVICRKVSFADAFGLDLVYVKEFDSTDLTGAEVADPPEPEVKVKEPEEYFLSSLFTVPSSPEELEQRLQDQKLELESIELLPGTTALRGIIRVVNLCYNKSLYIRITLDSWKTSFDLLAEYVPGSSDGTTDRFAFRLTLVPPFAMEGTKVEFCLRYETSLGTFWANNRDMNYVLFCHKKGGRGLTAMEAQLEEVNNWREKRSCLKVNSKMNSAEENPLETTTDAPDSATHRAEGAGRKMVDNAEHLLSNLHREEYHHKHLSCVPLVNAEGKGIVRGAGEGRPVQHECRNAFLSESRQQDGNTFPTGYHIMDWRNHLHCLTSQSNP